MSSRAEIEAACRAGLTVPTTLITSDPARAREFAAEQGELIYKPMTHVPPGRGRVLYAVPVTERDLGGEVGEAIAGTMYLLQGRVQQ